MMKKILLGNNISEISKSLVKCFKNLDFSVTCCENDEDVIFDLLKNGDYDALVFFAPYANNEICNFIRKLHTYVPAVKIYCMFYFNMEHNKTNVIDSGASKYFTTNSKVNNVFFEMIKDFLNEKSPRFSLEIAEFLVNLGVPCHLQSFYLVCVSMQKLIENPKAFKNFSKFLYPVIQKELNTTYYWAERGIRYISNSIYKEGIYFECYPKDSVLENKVLLRALINEFKKSKGRKFKKKH